MVARERQINRPEAQYGLDDGEEKTILLFSQAPTSVTDDQVLGVSKAFDAFRATDADDHETIPIPHRRPECYRRGGSITLDYGHRGAWVRPSGQSRVRRTAVGCHLPMTARAH